MQNPNLFGGFNPSQKYARQFGSFPQTGVKIKKYLKPPPRNPFKRMQRTIVVTSCSPTTHTISDQLLEPKKKKTHTHTQKITGKIIFQTIQLHVWVPLPFIFQGVSTSPKNETPEGSKLLKILLKNTLPFSLTCNLWNLKMLPWNRRCYFGKALFLRSMLNCWSVYLSHFWGWI